MLMICDDLSGWWSTFRRRKKSVVDVWKNEEECG